MSNGRFLPAGRPGFPSESKWRIIFSFFSGNGALISSTGGRALIFLPWIPVFLCHRPDLGAIPLHRFLLGEPTTPSFRGWIDTFPTTHWHRWSRILVCYMNKKNSKGLKSEISIILWIDLHQYIPSEYWYFVSSLWIITLSPIFRRILAKSFGSIR